MSKFIEVTIDGEKTLVNVDEILYVSDHTSNAYICLGEEVRFPIDETYEEIKAMLGIVKG